MNLNKNQSEAVQHRDGPCIVIAGPGSGKTAVITQRLKYLVRNFRIPAESILVVTFSRAAASEMRERYLSSSTHTSSTQPFFATFHSIFLKILQSSFGQNYFKLITEEEKEAIIQKILADTNSLKSVPQTLITETINKISRYKSSSDNNPPADMKAVFNAYSKRLESKKLIDFDDILLLTLKLFRNSPDILSFWQKHFKYILVDEFQDANNVQYEIIKLLAAPLNNIFVVGDDDQSIYGFRGARAGLMKKFTVDYPDCKAIMLDINYRSCEQIIKVSQKMISKNRGRFKRLLKSGTSVEDKLFLSTGYEHFSISGYENRDEEYYQIAKKIKKLFQSGISLSQIAVLTRNNAELKHTEKYFDFYGIPYVNYSNSIEDNDPNNNFDSRNHAASDNASNIAGSNNSSSREKGHVHIMTMHASKGLEFYVVFLPDVNSTIIPTKNIFDLSNINENKIISFLRALSGFELTAKQWEMIAEERRILYVGMTRAKQILHISYVKRLGTKHAIQSEFIDCLMNKKFCQDIS